MGVPTLSQIQGWDVEHLTAAADHWTGTADHWENAFTQAWQQAHGVSWEGHGANALASGPQPTRRRWLAMPINSVRQRPSPAGGGAIMGGLVGAPEGGVGAVPGALIGGASARIVDILHEVAGDGPKCEGMPHD